MAAAVSGEWLRSRTGSLRATRTARVVPHAPLPTTATRGEPGAAYPGAADVTL
jgi:hypothetical protein